MDIKRNGLRLVVHGLAALFCCASVASAQTAPSLPPAAEAFAVLGSSTVTNTGPTIITGDVGVSPGTAITGFGPGVLTGSLHAGDATAAAAQVSFTNAYNNVAGQTCTVNLTGQDLGGMILTPGVYCFSSSAQLTGTLTLNALGNPNAVFIFQIGSTITTASASKVVMINSAAACNVFWQVGSSATLGTTTSFEGNILALASITLTTGVGLTGRAVALNGAVTMDTNLVSVCATPPVCTTITVSPATVPNGTVGVAYSQTITASGGTSPYTFTVTSGALPGGVTLNSTTGVLAGTPTTAGTFNFTVTATDANGCLATRSYTIVVAAAPPPPPVCPTITLSPGTLPDGTVAVAYSQTLGVSGGTAPYSFGVTSGALPGGVTLSALGVLTGTPITAGTYTFTIRATDTNGCFADVSYTITIAAAPPPPPVCPTITLSPTSLPNGSVGLGYFQTIVGGGGVASYNFGVTSGALPTGITLSASGNVVGTPTSAGTSSFTIRGTDANGCFAARSFTLSFPMAVPSMPLAVVVVLAVGLFGFGYFRLRPSTRAY